jgi:hypothetical protein
MKYIPITVVIPGSDGDELNLTPTEAGLLLTRLTRELAVYRGLRERLGARGARTEMAKRYERRRR